MFGANFQLAQLAFGGVLNGLFSVGLLVVVGLVWRARSRMQQVQQQWYAQWESVATLCHAQLNEIKEVEHAGVMEWMRSGWLTDLAARLDAHQDLPDAEVASEQMMQCALHGKPFFFEQPDLHQPWERLPGVAILLGLLGTFLGLTLALTQLPFGGNLAQLTGGLQTVLPLMGTAFWTSVCGLIASLLLRFVSSQALQFQQMRADAYERLHGELSRRCRRELFPLLARAALVHPNRNRTPEAEGGVALSEASWVAALESQQEVLIARLTEALAPLQQELLQHNELLQSFPDRLEGLVGVLGTTGEMLEAWGQSLSTATNTFEVFAKHANDAMEPIAHTERLLGERISALTRQHEALTESIEAIARRERDFPDKLREILQLTLRPAHQSLQQTARGLQGSLELVFERDQQERESWRRMFQELGDRFSAIDRLAATYDKSTREIAQIADTLADLSNRLRFRMMANPRTPEESAEYQGDRALDAEIEELLEGISAAGASAAPQAGD